MRVFPINIEKTPAINAGRITLPDLVRSFLYTRRPAGKNERKAANKLVLIPPNLREITARAAPREAPMRSDA